MNDVINWWIHRYKTADFFLNYFWIVKKSIDGNRRNREERHLTIFLRLIWNIGISYICKACSKHSFYAKLARFARLEVSLSYVAISNDSKDQEKLHRRKAIKNLSKGEKRGCCASFSQSQPASSPTTLRLVSRLSIHFHSEMQRLRRSCETWL